MLHHHSQKPDDDLGAWPDKDLVLVFLFSIVSALENTERWWKEFSLNFSIGGSCAYSSFVNLLRSFIKQERVICLGHTTTAAKSLQSCLTLCHPIPGILQARTLEWVASFLLQCIKVKRENEVALSCLFETPWTAAYQAYPSMEIFRQEYSSRVPLPSLVLVINYPHTWAA